MDLTTVLAALIGGAFSFSIAYLAMRGSRKAAAVATEERVVATAVIAEAVVREAAVVAEDARQTRDGARAAQERMGEFDAMGEFRDSLLKRIDALNARVDAQDKLLTEERADRRKGDDAQGQERETWRTEREAQREELRATREELRVTREELRLALARIAVLENGGKRGHIPNGGSTRESEKPNNGGEVVP